MKKQFLASVGDKVSYKFTDNPFESLVVDITNRCNMSCNFCWNPQRQQSDMSFEYFKRLCAELPFPVFMKLSGGEPTLHPQLLDFMRVAHQYQHTVYIVSNGIKYADIKFIRSLKVLKDEGISLSLGISMDGGYLNRNAYVLINGQDCLADKVRAFDTLVDSGLGRVCLMATIYRGVNENVIPQLILLADKHPQAVRYIHFRNATKVGVWQETNPYTIEEMKALVCSHFSQEQFQPRCLREVYCSPEEKRQCCYRFRPNKRLQISLIEFNSQRSACCPKRGRVVNGVNGIQPFFMSMY
jgi:molybdenum cofactor biosynthesis enzyme MoaA